MLHFRIGAGGININESIKENCRIFKDKKDLSIYLYMGDKIQLDDKYYLDKFNIVCMIHDNISYILTNYFSHRRLEHFYYHYLYIDNYRWTESYFTANEYILLKDFISLTEFCEMMSYRKYFMDELEAIPALTTEDLFSGGTNMVNKIRLNHIIPFGHIRFIDVLYSDNIKLGIYNNREPAYVKNITIEPYSIFVMDKNKMVLAMLKDFDFDYYPLITLPDNRIEIFNKEYIQLDNSKLNINDIKNTCIIRQRLMNI